MTRITRMARINRLFFARYSRNSRHWRLIISTTRFDQKSRLAADSEAREEPAELADHALELC